MILVAVGSSLPFCGIDSQQLVLRSFLAIERFARVTRTSPLYTSPAWPDPSDPPFVNAVLAVETDLTPRRLLAGLHAVEAAFGRRRGVKNAPRTLDLDLIAYNDMQSQDAPILPHPRFAERDFVLAPLCDIAPDWRAPSGECAEALLAALPHRSAVRL